MAPATDQTMKATFDAKSLMSNITMKVTIRRYRQWLWRIKLAKWLIHLAALMMWADVEVEII
jgi:hypothetical protein